MSAPLAQVVAAHPELAAILASPAGHTEVAARLTELGQPTTEASVRRWRAKPASSGQLVPVVQAEIAGAEVVEPLTPALPDRVSAALTLVTPGQIDVESVNGITVTRVAAITDLATALAVKKVLEKTLEDGFDCDITIKATHGGTRLLVTTAVDDLVKRIVNDLRRETELDPFRVLALFAGELGEGFHEKTQVVGLDYGLAVKEMVPVFGPRGRRLLAAMRDEFSCNDDWDTENWKVKGGFFGPTVYRKKSAADEVAI